MPVFQPESLTEALECLAAHRPALLAGGTDFYPALQDRPPPPDVLDLTRIREFGGIGIAQGEVRIGAGVTWSRLIAHDLPPAFDALKQAGRTVGSVQIQNAATLAGNICNASPAADGVPPLLALEAEVELASASGLRRLALGSFITGVRQTALSPDEIVSAIIVPAPAPGLLSRFSKLGARRYLVISIAMTAVSLRIVDGRVGSARIAVGSCAPVAQRLTSLEGELQGMMAGDAAGMKVDTRHLAALSPLTDLRGSAAYRLAAVREMLARDIAVLIGEAAND